jgi:hypothetical protein
MRKSLLALALLTLSPLLFAQQSFNNAAIIKLVKAGLSDDLVISTINSQAGTYDTSADGIIALKTAGVSDKVVAAIVARAAAPSTSTPAPLLTANPTGLPAGIDEVGVYMKDKSGTWAAILPEIVNFKTGGVIKNIASAGIVKGDLNGHIAGPKAKVSATFPVTVAVYVPEGVAISEYQLLRLHVNVDSREFRSVTGGVMHVSGGATRDAIEFQADKIAPRVFQITLQSSIGKGEYGLLPPGANNTSNLGSSGKIFSVSVVE